MVLQPGRFQEKVPRRDAGIDQHRETNPVDLEGANMGDRSETGTATSDLDCLRD